MLPADLNIEPCARLRAAYLGSHWANDADRTLARLLEQFVPGTGDLSRGAREWHRRAALWSLSLACGGGVICGAGLPVPPETYRAESGAVLHGRWVLADPGVHTTAVNRSVAARDASGRVAAIQAAALDPDDVLSRPEVQAIGGPLSVHSEMSAQFWPGDAAAETVAGWGRLLPAGSAFCLSAWLADDVSEAGRRWLATMRGVAGAFYVHSAGDVRAWFERAPRLQVREFTVRYREGSGTALVRAQAA